MYVRAADELQPREIPGAEGSAYPFFSPDGATLAFYANGQLQKVAVSGGRTQVLADAPGLRGATWSASGWVVASNGVRLTKTPAAGGAATPFTLPDSAKGETAQMSPVALPDGKTVLYASYGMGGAANSRIGVASIGDGSATILDLLGSFPLGVID